MIRHAAMSDAAAIAGIYNYYVVNTAITFEEEMLSADQMAKRIGEVNSAALPWLVAEQSGRVVGYAYAGKWKTRSAYRFSVESAIYLQDGASGKGVGGKLYEELLRIEGAQRSRRHWRNCTAKSKQCRPSCEVRLRKVAHFEEVGFKFGRWLDVGYWQKVLTPDPSNEELSLRGLRKYGSRLRLEKDHQSLLCNRYWVDFRICFCRNWPLPEVR